MGIVVGQIKKDAAFKDENGNIIHILDSTVEKGWQSAQGKLRYSTLHENGMITSHVSSFETFKNKMPNLDLISRNELAERYDQLAK
jgi:hypothetical protein